MDLLEQLVKRGYRFQVFEAYPRQLGAVKDNCIMLLDLSEEGRWVRFSSPGYLIDGEIGLLIERRGRQVFVHKSVEIAADDDLLKIYRSFVAELTDLLASQSPFSRPE